MKLNFYNNGQHHWAPVCFVVNKLSHLVPEESLKVIRVHRLMARDAIYDIPDFIAYLIKYRLVFFEVDETARDNVRIL